MIPVLDVRTVTLPQPTRGEIGRRLAAAGNALTRHLARARRRGKLDEAAVAGAIRATFDDLGGTFAKFAQLIASSPSIFGDAVSAEFRGALDAAPPVPFVAVRSAIEADLGQPMGELFASFDPEPFAAASLAVVHRATLADGTPVAVKVLRPGIERRIAVDLAVLSPLCRFLARQVAVGIAGTLSGLVEGLRNQVAEELDLGNERRAIEWFQAVLDEVEPSLVRVPAVIADRCGRSTLTMELLEGVPIDDVAGIAALGVDPGPLVRDCLRTWFATTLATGSFHGDIHAGNVLVQPGGTIALLDWGIVGRLDAETASFFRRLIEGALGDESAWVDVAAHLKLSYGDGMVEMLGLDDAGFVEFVRSQVEPLLRLPFGQVDLRTMLVGDGAADGKRAGTRTRREAFTNWREERRRQQALMSLEGYGGGFDQATFLLSKQLVYFDRYGKLFLPDTPLLDDPAAFRALLGAPPLQATA